jgi:hypothetical protein
MTKAKHTRSHCQAGGPTDRLLTYLEEHPRKAFTSKQLAAATGVSDANCRGLLRRLSVATKERPQAIHITGFDQEATGERRYPRPRYAIGPGRNAKLKDAKERGREASRRWREKQKRNAYPLSSIFVYGKLLRAQLGVPRVDLAGGTRLLQNPGT